MNDNAKSRNNNILKRTWATCLILGFLFLNSSCSLTEKQKEYTGNELSELKTSLATGWNTWDTRSVLTHVLLPEGFALDLQVKESKTGEILEDALIGRETYGSKELVIPGPHAYDGSYTELELKWRQMNLRVQSAVANEQLYLLITPLETGIGDSLLITPKMLWEREGQVQVERNLMTGKSPLGTTKVYVNGDGWIAGSDDIRVTLDRAIAISSGAAASSDEVAQRIGQAKASFEQGTSRFDRSPELYNAMQTVLAWDIIYEPTRDRVIAPVSRTWNVGWEGWILFDWDTYFAAYMFSLDNREHAYANAIAITNEITENGFIPNFGSARCTSEDRSQPPVGSFVIREIYRRYGERWLLQEVFDKLLSWNRWWPENRDLNGYLCWGSDPYEHGPLPAWLEKGIGAKQGAKWESGLDNSPMYDEAVFDTTRYRLMQADVGLISFYILDCRSLAEIASVLGKTEIAEELSERAESYSEKLATLWNEKFGLYLNKDLVTGEFSYRLSPTLFYPLLAKVPNQKQAERMIQEHFYNPEEFWGEYIIPSIARNDAAYPDNIYWRGRIWAPLNFLVYLGIRNYDLPDAEHDLVEKSSKLLLKSWLEERHVYENYSAETGRGDDAGMSDKFYHWGALLGFIGIIDEGYVPSPQIPLTNND